MNSAAAVGAVLAYGYGRMNGDGGNGWRWLCGGIMMILLVAAFGLIAWAIVRSTDRSGPHPHDRAREILAERLARGEITPEEYQDRVQHLA